MSLKAVLISLGVLATTLVILYSTNANAQSKSDDEEYATYLIKHGKLYLSESERNFRMKIFSENRRKVLEHNSTPGVSYTLTLNSFADFTLQELESRYLTPKGTGPDPHGPSKCEKVSSMETKIDPIPRQVDWEKAGKVQVVKDQKGCGSCWAFSAVGALESAYALEKGELPSLSEQELVDCSHSYGNDGCDGGYMHWAYDYVMENGLNTEADYKYWGIRLPCRKSTSKQRYTLKKCVKVGLTTDDLTASLVGRPVAAGFYVNWDFWLYDTGIFNPKKCEGDANHGILITGYSLDDNIPHYRIKNSWGKDWGENGYFRMAIGKEAKGTCVIAGSGFNYYPVL